MRTEIMTTNIEAETAYFTRRLMDNYEAVTMTDIITEINNSPFVLVLNHAELNTLAKELADRWGVTYRPVRGTEQFIAV